MVFTASNTAIFLQVWKHIWHNQLHLQYVWMVKVDPDAVLVPDRMRMLLQDRKEKMAVIFDGEQTKCGDRGMGGVAAMTRDFVDGMMKLYYTATSDPGVQREDTLIWAAAHALGAPLLDEPNFKRNGWVTPDHCS